MNGTKTARVAMTWLISIILAIVVTACTPPVVQDQSPGATADRQAGQAEALSRKGDYRGAARAYETMAAQQPGELRDRFFLRAAREYVRADDTAQATSLLNQVSTSLPRADFGLRSLVTAELALRGGRGDKALAELDRIPQPVPSELTRDVLEVRSRSLFALNRPAAAVSTALERERTLSSQDEIRANQRLIWQGLQKSAAANADFTPPAGASQTLAGWLDLGRAALVTARNPFSANEDIAQWRTRYPSHPANSLITEDVLPQLGVGLNYPTQIALILPLSGRQQAAGMAVRDGFLAALLQQESSRRPVLNVYDSAEMGASTAYRRAVADGAQFIVGPLTKDEVTAIASSGETSVLTLALNQTADNVAPPPLLFQFSLDPEEEARQVAQRVAADGRMRGLVMLPNNEWGQRVYRAFDAELKTLGGDIAGMKFYDPSARDYSQPITELLLINESRARANALSATLGQRFEFEPRRRGDAQFVFIGAQPVQGRSLRPGLSFHLSEDLPVYATSDIFEPDSQANNDLEGVIFPDMPWVISPDAASTQLRTALSRHWPVRARGRGRLYAFGFDACRIVPLLKAGQFGSQHAIPGMTGLLSIDDKGHVKRELDWAKVSGGRALPLGTAATAAR
ncbi:penicillin-binding protein activator [Steroidobacter sp.]|uniref:penicillin-binding protein activator n=1 Tax=Steroidobacter sp. TaxID=1978227 RepID=UPI001A37D0AB|nr:penicillin-binding protein activator [Steroidobacter sp.]MBL8266718.1 penicillin-binding protein activator [Steroidobacter sp.]